MALLFPLAAAHSLMGAGRARNEDACCQLTLRDPLGGPLRRPLRVFAVADGHGGAGAAAFFTAALEAALEAALAEHAGDLKAALAAAVLAVDAAWLQGPGRSDDSGACVLLCVCEGSQVHTAWAGDCRAVLYRGAKREAELLSRDHTLCNAQERERLLRARVPVRRGRVLGVLQPTRAIGNRRLRETRSDAVLPLCETRTADAWAGATPPATPATPDSSDGSDGGGGLSALRPRSPQRKVPCWMDEDGDGNGDGDERGRARQGAGEGAPGGWRSSGHDDDDATAAASPSESLLSSEAQPSPASSSESEDSATTAHERQRQRRRRRQSGAMDGLWQQGRRLSSSGFPEDAGDCAPLSPWPYGDAQPSFLILGTDGLWDGLSSARACDVVLDALSALSADATAALVQETLDQAAAKLCRMGRSYGDDDCTCMVVML